MTISNNPPPFEAFSMEIEDLANEAQSFLDGEPISSQGQADDVSALLEMVRKAKKDADAHRAAEKKPHDDAAKAVQARWKPLIDKCDLVATVAKRALTPWLQHLEEQQRIAAEEARKIADEKARIAREAEQAMHTNLAAAEDAEKLIKEARIADALANRADKAKPQATGGARAIGLRTSFRVEMVDPLAFGKWAWINCRDEYLSFLDEIARREIRANPHAPLPGVTVHEERNAA